VDARARLAVLVVPLILLTGCTERWDGFLYPEKGDLTTHIVVGTGAKSLEECRMNVTSHPSYRPGLSDYECGLNCKFNKSMGVYFCKETMR